MTVTDRGDAADCSAGGIPEYPGNSTQSQWRKRSERGFIGRRRRILGRITGSGVNPWSKNLRFSIAFSLANSGNDLKEIMRFTDEKKKGPAIAKLVATSLMLRRRRELSDEVMSGKVRI